MSQTRDYGKVIFVCDSCGDELLTGYTHVDAAEKMLAPSGWAKVKSVYKGPAEHYCSHCKE